ATVSGSRRCATRMAIVSNLRVRRTCPRRLSFQNAEEAEYGFDQTHHSDRGCCGSGDSRRTALVRTATRDWQILRKGPGSHLLRAEWFRLPSLAASGRRTERDDRILHP